MKTFYLFLLVVLFNGIINHSAFSQEQNCEEAKKKYLIENPDVAKAGVDAWSHYWSNGKNEGRKWPDCLTAKEVEKVIQYVISLGATSELVSSFYTRQYLHQEFDFYDEPISILKKDMGLPSIFGEVNIAPQTDPLTLSSSYAKSERSKLESLLKGLIELKKQDSIMSKELATYPTFRVSELEDYYKILKQNLQIIDFGSHWSQYAKKIKKACNLDFGYNFSGKFFKTYEKNDLGYGYRKIMFTNTGIISLDPKIIKKFSNIVTKAITIHPEIEIIDNKEIYIENETGLNEEYFLRKKQLFELKERIRITESYLFLNLPKKQSSNSQTYYIGNTQNGIPSGFGYLLNEQKQLIFAAHWDEGFPVTLYNINLYHNPNIEIKQFVYFGDTYSKKYANRFFYSYPHGYEGEKTKTFKLSIGKYTYSSSENINHNDGYGCYFFSSWNKNDKQYYIGDFKNSRRDGFGTHYTNDEIYEGIWENGSIISGKITSKVDKSIYNGEIKDWRMHGQGKKVYANGKVEEGIFEKGTYVMSVKQYSEEQNRKAQQRISEERRQEELKLAEERQKSEKDYNKLLKALDLFLSDDGNDYTSNNSDNDNIRDSKDKNKEKDHELCPYCSKKSFFTVWKGDWTGNCHGRFVDFEESKPGYVKCKSCNSYGEQLDRIPFSNCPKSERCNEYDCQNGWSQCRSCSGTGKKK
jgi:hypothetical protein